MTERVIYYLELIATLCGFDGSDGSYYLGWFVVSIATGLVIYAFYTGISKAIYPGEEDQSHIKYQIFDDADVEELDRAH